MLNDHGSSEYNLLVNRGSNLSSNTKRNTHNVVDLSEQSAKKLFTHFQMRQST